MAKVVPGRMTHQHDGELVVFLIGMTINKPWRVDLWWPAFRAMPKMLRELSEVEDSGLLGHRLMLEGRNPTLIQYWDSLGGCTPTRAHATPSTGLRGGRSTAVRTGPGRQSASGTRPT